MKMRFLLFAALSGALLLTGCTTRDDDAPPPPPSAKKSKKTAKRSGKSRRDPVDDMFFGLGKKSDTPDFAAFIVEHMNDRGKLYNVGGKETWSYEELAKMFFAAAGKEPNISRAPVWLFDVLAWVNKKKKNGKEAIIRFSKWTLTEEMVGDTVVGESSFAEYIKNCYRK